MPATIFKTCSLDRKRVRWENYLRQLTPVEKVDGLWLKREDYFAPLGPGRINGSKLRQLIWLVNEARLTGAKTVVGGAVSGSPQHPMLAAVAAHYELQAIVLSGTRDAVKYPTLAQAVAYGATLLPSTCGYAKTLEAYALRYAARTPNCWVLETNITVDLRRNSAARVEAFHAVGAHQTSNLPEDVETLVVPAGSCNSVTSVLYGLHQKRPRALRRVVLMGIGAMGSSNPAGVYDRLKVIEDALGPSYAGQIRGMYRPRFIHDYGKEPQGLRYTSGALDLIHVNVNNGCGACPRCAGGFTRYADMLPYTWGGVAMHPRYEGKCWNFLDAHPSLRRQILGRGPTAFWIVGGEQSI